MAFDSDAFSTDAFSSDAFDFGDGGEPGGGGGDANLDQEPLVLRRFWRGRARGLWCLLLVLLAGCATEVVQLYECRCQLVYATVGSPVPDSVVTVAFDTLATEAECQEAGRAYCPTVR